MLMLSYFSWIVRNGTYCIINYGNTTSLQCLHVWENTLAKTRSRCFQWTNLLEAMLCTRYSPRERDDYGT